ncbi:hypothetical protein KL918_002524 [Ogataea parapolymorpha]|uniref:Acid phosphatase n=1 Tax=Ogataea parapolymorpha (strain ATCC 26012 / BCRC 20466 / JCM 22074 / NRRL Y-7560 / DL-1) TaxID=871575 RepID=W1QJ98_OGAPD|nr:hypothetical protein HPODL_02034 [Ogataea parapolymorpha DL-1]ESX02707.1 hypothetical protein HPODL_02034 [Ogataea parapolymorpha DL-1]KAG7867927.1 hypothetical protein KL918_002524 [Ogataea parapolymorpha]KAG7870495.1 hypothetical protein KL916_004971 [Ogataea parapolymorpha]
MQILSIPNFVMFLLLSLLPIALAVDSQSLDGKYSCVGTFIFGRHNDRVAKPANYLTTLGAVEQVESGTFYRERYFGLDEDGNSVNSDFVINGLDPQGYFVYGDTYAQCPASTVIEYSQMSFLQGLYPPSTAVNTNETLADTQDSELSNGTSVEAPLGGYQYVFMDVQSETSDDYFWIKGDENCPSSDAAIDAWYDTEAFKALNSSTFDFYQSLADLLPSTKFPKSKLNFGNAMNINDFVFVESIHDEDWATKWNSSLRYQIATLADAAQWGISYDASNKLNNFTIGGQSLLGASLTYLNATKEKGSPYINYFTGSFNTMYQIFGLLELNQISDNFTGMPGYGATLVWDLLKDTSDNYFVQFSFKNGTDDDDELVAYPLFGLNSTVLSWDDFVAKTEAVSITNLEDWCGKCSSTSSQCTRYSSTYEQASEAEDKGIDLEKVADGSYHLNKLTNAGAGGIGAGVTIGVFLILGALVFAWKKLRSKKAPLLPVAKTVSRETKAENSSASNAST